MDFCADFIKYESDFKDNILAAKIYLNLSYMNFLNSNYEDSLNFANKGINFSNSVRSQYALGHFYGRKGFAEYRLGKEEYLESFIKSSKYLSLTFSFAISPVFVETRRYGPSPSL